MRGIFFLGLVLSYTLSVNAQFADSTAPSYAVIDTDSFFDHQQHEQLNAIADSLFNKDGTRLWIIIKDSTDNDIMLWTQSLFRQWDLNKNGTGRSILFVYLYKRKGLRIETSDLITQELGKKYTKDLLSLTVIPKMQKRKDFEGIRDGCNMIYLKLINNLE